MHNFPIIPNCARPYLSIKDGSFDDDLICELADIVRANNTIKSEAPASSKDYQRLNLGYKHTTTIIKKVGILYLDMLTWLLRICWEEKKVLFENI